VIAAAAMAARGFSHGFVEAPSLVAHHCDPRRPVPAGQLLAGEDGDQFLIRYGQVVLGEGRRVGLALVTTRHSVWASKMPLFGSRSQTT